MANFPSVTAAGAFESPAVRDAIKALAAEAVQGRLAELEYDTGWRDVSGLLTNGWTAAQVRVRRTGNWGHLRFQSLNGSAATDPYFVSGLNGFFAGGQNLSISIGTVPATLWVPNAGDRISLNTSSPVSSSTVQVSQYIGGIARPSTLPGSPA